MGERPLTECQPFDPCTADDAETDKKPMSALSVTLIGIAVVVVLFLAYGAKVSNTPLGKEKAAARDAIDLCLKEQERKSLTPQEARFIAGACEMMENDFSKKYGVRP